MLRIPDDLAEGASLQQFLELSGVTLEQAVKPKFLGILQGEDLSQVPWGVVLLDDRAPTQTEIEYGQNLMRHAQD